MPDFTAAELEQAANAALDYHWNTPRVRAQTLQDRPLLKALESAERTKTFPGGKGDITFRVKGEYTTDIQGFINDDEVTYGNPGNIKTGSVPWYLYHAGIQFSMHELLKDGISISDTSDGSGERRHSDRDMTVLANMLADKIDDMAEGTARARNLMYWRDGTADPNLIPGVRSFVLDDPTTATVVEGIDQSSNTWWRNRASLLLNVSTPGNLVLVTELQNEWRQLRRYGGRPNRVLCGSDFLDAFEQELRSKGNFTLEGWAKSGRMDASVADVMFKGTPFEYDPTLDDEGLAKYCFVLDTRFIYRMPIEGEDGKDHRPARPPEKYVFYRAKTWAEGLVCDKRNAQGVYSIA